MSYVSTGPVGKGKFSWEKNICRIDVLNVLKKMGKESFTLFLTQAKHFGGAL